MQVQVTIKNVDVEQKAAVGKGRPYEIAEVFYESGGRNMTQKVVSFANPAVFAAVKSAVKGDQFTVTVEKNDKGYNQWTAITKSDGSVASAPPGPSGLKPAPTPTAPGRSNFETPEERALRQRLIVRQSSLSTAAELLTTGAKSPPEIEAVLNLAEVLHDWVYKKPDIFDAPNDIDSDIPF